MSDKSSEVVQLIEYAYDSQFSTDWLINLAELCDFCLEYGCYNVNESAYSFLLIYVSPLTLTRCITFDKPPTILSRSLLYSFSSVINIGRL